MVKFMVHKTGDYLHFHNVEDPNLTLQFNIRIRSDIKRKLVNWVLEKGKVIDFCEKKYVVINIPDEYVRILKIIDEVDFRKVRRLLHNLDDEKNIVDELETYLIAEKLKS